MWRLGWALDTDERPPPSSIVGRLDTEEALRFSRAVDRRWLLEFTAAAGDGQGLGPLSSSWRSAGAATMMAIWFTTKLQRAGVVEQEGGGGAGGRCGAGDGEVVRGPRRRSVEVLY